MESTLKGNDHDQEPKQSEPRHVKTNKVSVRPAKTQISLGIRPVWSESSLPAWRKLPIEHTAKTGRMPRLIWVFAGCTLTLLVLSCRGSFNSTSCPRHQNGKEEHKQWNTKRKLWKSQTESIEDSSFPAEGHHIILNKANKKTYRKRGKQ